jgi:hypothetical protein
VVKGVAQVTSAVAKYTQAFADLKQKTENYKKAVDHNAQVIKAF